MEFYKRHIRFGADNAKQRHYFIIGRWDHAGTRTPKQEFGGQQKMLDSCPVQLRDREWLYLKRRCYSDSVNDSLATANRSKTRAR